MEYTNIDCEICEKLDWIGAYDVPGCKVCGKQVCDDCSDRLNLEDTKLPPTCKLCKA